MAAVMVCSPAGLAQSTTSARLTGSVTDPSGAVVPNTTIIALDTDTNLSVTAKSDSAGNYAFNSLPVGHYKVTASAPGFDSLIETGIELTVGQSATLNLPLRTGTAQEAVTVTDGADLINTTTADLSQIIGEDTIKDLPLNGRDPGTLVTLSAGVTNELNSNASTLQTTNSFPNESGASAGGQRQGSTWYLLDGVSHMDTYLLLALPFPNPDATQEFRVISNNFDARNGFAPAAIVSIETKSGTNQFHGGAFDFLRNSSFNAADYFSGPGHDSAKAVDPLHRNQFGVFVGGPVPRFKDKLFFFSNYQGTRQDSQAETNTTFTPTQAERNGDFTALLSNTTSTGVADPIHLPAPFVNNKIDPSLFSPGAVKLLANIPVGSNPQTGELNVAFPKQPTSFNENTSRLDYNLSDSQRLFVRSFVNYYNQTAEGTPGNILVGVAGTDGIFLSEVLNHTWTINPSTLNTIAFGYTGYDLTTGTPVRDANGNPICLSQFINVQDPPNDCYLEDFNVSNGSNNYALDFGFTSFSSNPFKTKRTDYSLTDTFTKTLGRHTIMAGFDVFHRHHTEASLFSESPIINFDGHYNSYQSSVSGNLYEVPFADFLLGETQSITQAAGEQNTTTQWMLGFYGQDQYKLKPNLTVTLGLRWDPNTPAHVAGGRGADYVPGQQSTRFPNAPLGLVFPGDTGINDQLYKASYGYFEPRIGFAWAPRPTTAVRAAFGLFTTPMEDAFYQEIGDVAPFAPQYGLSNGPNAASPVPVPFDNPWVNFPGGGGLSAGKSPFPPFAGPNQNPSSASLFLTSSSSSLSVPATFSPTLKLGVTQSWNLSVEQQLGKADALHIAYVGSESYHQATTVDANPGVAVGAGVQPPSGNPRINPVFGSVLQVQDGGTSSYSALQVGIQHKFSHGLQLQSNYTWSRTTDVGGSGDPTFESSVTDPYNVGHDKGISSLNVPNVWVTSGIYRLPAFASSNFLTRNLLGGWELSAIYTAESGEPFSINPGNGRNRSGFDVGQDLVDNVPGVSRAVRQGGKSHWLNQYFNPAAFAPNEYGTAGNFGKYSIDRPPVYDMDSAFIKNFSVHEGINTQFRWEMFNATNTPSFGAPGHNLASGNIGQIQSTGPIPARVMQAALKLTF
jgi:outer membrane receptor protein involved in Fe transport